jgi:hypothetical protein
MATKPGQAWQSVLMDIDLPAEYAGEDIDRTSALVDLGFEASGVMIFVPTIDSATIGLLVQRDGAIATVPVPLHWKKVSDDSTTAWVTTAGTGGYMIHVPLGGIQYFRILTGANQTADRTFYVKGTV